VISKANLNMTKEENGAAWISWLLDAIHKIKYQKQRPNVERVAACIRQHHPQYSNETVFQHLEESVRNGLIQRHENKGNVSYKDPDSLPRGKSKALKLNPTIDLTKVFVKAVREMGEIDGSTIRSIEKFVVSSYEIEFEQECDVKELLHIAAKKSLSRGLVIHNADNNSFRAVIGRKGHSANKNKQKEERERERREKKEKRREEKREKKERKLKKKQKNVSSSTEESPVKKPQVVPICTECLGTESSNPVGEAESLVSCYGCGQSVHPSCRAYSPELVHYFEQHGWTCDDCKPCIVCDESPNESDKSEDLLVCEYCDPRNTLLLSYSHT